MILATTEFDRMAAQLQALAPRDWAQPTVCELWDVRAMAAHVLGMAEAQASFRQFAHDFRAAGQRSGGKMIDEMTATQVRERTAMTPGAIVSRLAVVAPKARRHGQPFTLTLTGPAGGQWRSGEAGEHLELDALDFCWIVAGRQPGTGLMATKVPF
jgi:uncharacterized protein (TIGR03083 family)